MTTTLMTDPADERIRVVTVINKELEPGKAMNTIAHLAIGLGNIIGESGREALSFLDFVDGDGDVHPSISARSLIVLRGTSNEISKLRAKAKDGGIPFVDFTDTMTGDTYVEQLERTATTPGSTLKYSGIALVGQQETLQPLTKRFSMWK